MTVLSNRTLPLIRYELSDQIALEPAACACGKR
jgi:phenylacetate-coenzyme A ligase PaaK-like adenylate-forming protein